MDHIGILSLLPVIVTLGTALIFRKTFEALLLGCLFGYLMIEVMTVSGPLPLQTEAEVTEPVEVVSEAAGVTPEAESGLVDTLLIPVRALDRFIGGLSETMTDSVTVWLILGLMVPGRT